MQQIGDGIVVMWWGFFDWLAVVSWKKLLLVSLLGLILASILRHPIPFLILIVASLIIKVVAGGKRRADVTADEATRRAETEQLERTVLEARMEALQAQIEPHFLFNTLANVQALVDAGSPQASAVLRSLIAYLRAAVPRLNEPATTLGQELELARAYLELMHMRIPDRLEFALHMDEAARSLHCPPLTLLTLVENAVHHGIDPSEEGGRIDISVQRRSDRCIVRVSDTGVGLKHSGNGLGTGLATLRGRLALAFGSDARLSIGAQQPRGVCAELDIPAREAAT